jgi:lipoprotein-anchoring transpeptidase ErfK/SrfK
MRPTWLILAVLVAAGVVAYSNLAHRAASASGQAHGAQATAPATPTRPAGSTPLERNAEQQPLPAPSADVEADDAHAKEILARIGEASAHNDRVRYDAELARLRAEAWDAPSARAFAVRLGWTTLGEVAGHHGLERVQRLDAARRLLSRGVWLDAYFGPDGRPTAEREKLLRAIELANDEVMTWGRNQDGLGGVTRAYLVQAGEVPVQIVSRQKLPYGPNALLWWNRHRDLDPTKLQAGKPILLPVDALTLQIDLTRRRVAIFLGDAFVKEFLVGVGRAETPTPVGDFTMGAQRHENPDWWHDGKVIPYGDPRNELGSAWMPIENDVYANAGIGIHGTNKPDTVGTCCSNGCVRLLNGQATELYYWTRSPRQDGPPTRVLIREHW